MTHQKELKHFLENDTMTIDEHLRLICQAQGQASTPSHPPGHFSPSPMLSRNSSLPKRRLALSKIETHLLSPHQYFLLYAFLLLHFNHYWSNNIVIKGQIALTPLTFHWELPSQVT